MKSKHIVSTRDGFTLVEMITVLVILTVLSAMVIPSMVGFIDKARERIYVNEAQGVRYSLELYLLDHYTGDQEDYMELVADLVGKDPEAEDSPLKDYLTTDCTRGAKIENVTLDPERGKVLELLYRVGDYLIEFADGEVKVTRTPT